MHRSSSPLWATEEISLPAEEEGGIVDSIVDKDLVDDEPLPFQPFTDSSLRLGSPIQEQEGPFAKATVAAPRIARAAPLYSWWDDEDAKTRLGSPIQEQEGPFARATVAAPRIVRSVPLYSWLDDEDAKTIYSMLAAEFPGHSDNGEDQNRTITTATSTTSLPILPFQMTRPMTPQENPFIVTPEIPGRPVYHTDMSSLGDLILHENALCQEGGAALGEPPLSRQVTDSQTSAHHEWAALMAGRNFCTSIQAYPRWEEQEAPQPMEVHPEIFRPRAHILSIPFDEPAHLYVSDRQGPNESNIAIHDSMNSTSIDTSDLMMAFDGELANLSSEGEAFSPQQGDKKESQPLRAPISNKAAKVVPSPTKEKKKVVPPSIVKPLSPYNFFFTDVRDFILRLGEKERSKLSKYLAEQKQKGEATKSTELSPYLDSKLLLSLHGEEHKNRLLINHWHKDRTKRRPHRMKHGKIGFGTLNQACSTVWRTLPEHGKGFYTSLAAADRARYNKEVDGI